MPVADIRSLTVRYGRFTALEDFTCTIPEGSVGLLGPNGAGKTTFLKALLGFIKPAGGSGVVLGEDIARGGKDIRRLIGYMPEQDCHMPGVSAVSYLAFVAELAGLPTAQALRRSHEVLEYCGLGEARYREIEGYSTGMKQRIKLATALVHGPKLLLLDEPTNGLDPRGREEMLQLIRQTTKEQSLSAIVCSHLLPDIERTCDHVIVLLGGRLQMQGDIGKLRELPGRPLDVELKEPIAAFTDEIRRQGLQITEAKGFRFRLAGDMEADELARRAFAAANSCGAQIRAMRLAQRSLEEAFMEAVGG